LIDKVRLDNTYRKSSGSSSNPSSKHLPYDAELLLREPGEKGVVYEPTKIAPTPKPEKDKPQEKSSLSLRVSSPAPVKEAKHTAKEKPVEKPAEKTAEKAEETSSPLLDSIRSALSKVFGAIRSFFSKLWNGPDGAKTKEETDGEIPVEDIAAAEAAGEPAAISAATEIEQKAPAAAKAANPAADDLLQEIIASHDREKLMQYLTANGKKKPARNTDILTSYNARGRIVPVSPSDRTRILEGERNSVKM
jgi:hypothetical protein